MLTAAADFAHARDAGKGESREIHLADPASSHSWRFSDVGAY